MNPVALAAKDSSLLIFYTGPDSLVRRKTITLDDIKHLTLAEAHATLTKRLPKFFSHLPSDTVQRCLEKSKAFEKFTPKESDIYKAVKETPRKTESPEFIRKQETKATPIKLTNDTNNIQPSPKYLKSNAASSNSSNSQPISSLGISAQMTNDLPKITKPLGPLKPLTGALPSSKLNPVIPNSNSTNQALSPSFLLSSLDSSPKVTPSPSIGSANSSPPLPSALNQEISKPSEKISSPLFAFNKPEPLVDEDSTQNSPALNKTTNLANTASPNSQKEEEDLPMFVEEEIESLSISDLPSANESPKPVKKDYAEDFDQGDLYDF